jgi:hypothetical protein
MERFGCSLVVLLMVTPEEIWWMSLAPSHVAALSNSEPGTRQMERIPKAHAQFSAWPQESATAAGGGTSMQCVVHTESRRKWGRRLHSGPSNGLPF